MDAQLVGMIVIAGVMLIAGLMAGAGIGAYLTALRYLGNIENMTLLEEKFEESRRKERIEILHQALQLAERLSVNVVPANLYEAIDLTEDFLDEITDGEPIAEKSESVT